MPVTDTTAFEIEELAPQDPELAEWIDLFTRATRESEPKKIQEIFGDSMRRLSGAAAYAGISIRGLAPGQYKVTKLTLEGEPLGRDINPWQQWDSLPTHTGGLVGRLITTPTPKVVHDIDLSDDPAMPSQFCSMRSALAVPLFDGGEALNWGILLRTQPRWEIDFRRLRDFISRGQMLGNTVKLLVTNSRVEELNRRLSDQLQQVAQIQQSLLPAKTPKAPGLEIASSYLTSNEAGGDYFDFFDMGGGRFGVFIADVSGHGAGAATVMAMLRTILHGFKDRHLGPAAMLAHANRELLANELNSNFVTAFLAVFSADRSEVVYSNAGHNPPIVLVPGGEVIRVTGASSLPLGIIEEAEYTDEGKQTRAGATLVLYTDGITEAAPDAVGKLDMFGEQRLIDAAKETSGAPSDVVEHIHARLFEHTGKRSRDDDQTLLVVRHVPGHCSHQAS
ncbi:MAG: PP2C family protein-serine/threonine phosphatase [Planctomycetota bacterium]